MRNFAELNPKNHKGRGSGRFKYQHPGELSDLIAANVFVEVADKMEVLSETNHIKAYYKAFGRHGKRA